MKLAAIYSHPVQYTAPLFRELASRPGVDLMVYFLSRHGLEVSYDPMFGKAFKWDIPLLDGYPHQFAPNVGKDSGVGGFFKLRNLALVDRLRVARHDAVLIHGYEHFAKWPAFAAAKSVGSRIIFHGESHLNEPRTVLRTAVKSVVLRNLFRSFDAFGYIGTLNRQYFEHYGVPAEKLYLAPYTVDNDFFASKVLDATPRRAEIRATLGITDSAPIILWTAKLTEVKQPELMLRAFAKVRRGRPCHMLFVGDGVLRPVIEALVAHEKIPDVKITGFVNQSRIPEMYAVGDIFAMPSFREPWGLSVNEAMSAGLPVVVSDRVGSSLDLVQQGRNGFIVPYDSVDSLATRLDQLVKDEALRKAFSARSLDIISRWSIRETADGILAAARGDKK